MVNRIDWKENATSRQRDERQGAIREWLAAEDEQGAPKDMSENECLLIFEGEAKARAFKRWGSKVCETDTEAREILSRHHMADFWSLAKGCS